MAQELSLRPRLSSGELSGREFGRGLSNGRRPRCSLLALFRRLQKNIPAAIRIEARAKAVNVTSDQQGWRIPRVPRIMPTSAPRLRLGLPDLLPEISSAPPDGTFDGAAVSGDSVVVVTIDSSAPSVGTEDWDSGSERIVEEMNVVISVTGLTIDPGDAAV